MAWKDRVEQWAAEHNVVLKGEWGFSKDFKGELEATSFVFEGGTPQLTEKQCLAAGKLGIIIEPTFLRVLHDGDAQFPL
jgi:hypothetical protein